MLRRWLAALVCCWIGSTWAQTVDCNQAVQINHAVRTLERGGVLLERTEVGAMDPLPRTLLNEATTVRYQIALPVCQGGQDQGLWVYRIGAPYRIAGDGQPLRAIAPSAEPGNHVFNGRAPALFVLPSGTRTLEIQLATIPYLNFGLIRLETGPQHALAQSRAFESNVLTTFNDTSSAVIGMVSVLALGLWWRRRQDKYILWLGLGCLVWTVRGATYQFFTIPIDPLRYESINPWTVFLTCAGTSASALYSLDLMTKRRGWILALWALLISAGFVASNLLHAGGFWIRGLAFLSGFVLIAPMPWLLWRRRSSGQLSAPLLTMGYLTLLACAAHDIGMVIGYVTPDHWSVNNFGFTAMLLTYTISGSQYLVRSLNRAEQSNQELESAIAAKSAQLEASFALLRESERTTARIQEREHLLREMHDGLGAQLMTAMRGVERGTLARDQILLVLQDSLDDLRLLMDSTDMGRQLQGALASWRHRWNPRLEALGLRLVWSVEDDLDAVQLSPDAVLQVMRILQEATVNVVKHAQAQEVNIAAGWARPDKAEFLLTVQDDGTGLAEGSPIGQAGRGLRNMKARAQLMGGSLLVQALATGGTVVTLRLPAASGH